MDDPAGIWYLHLLRYKQPGKMSRPAETRMVFKCEPASAGFSAMIAIDVQPPQWQPVDNLGWDSSASCLTFRRVADTDAQWFRVFVSDGVVGGRYTEVVGASAPEPPVHAYTGHLTGWNETVIDGGDIVPRVWEVRVAGDELFLARVRIDGSPPSECVGRFKIYGVLRPDDSDDSGSWYEEPEMELSQIYWDGRRISFVRSDPAQPSWFQSFQGEADGRRIDGAWTDSTRPGVTFRWGSVPVELAPPLLPEPGRVEVLGFGLRPRATAERTEWQRRTRRRILRLIQGGGPAPASVSFPPVTPSELLTLKWMTPLLAPAVPERDDSPAPAQNYSIAEVEITSEIPNPYGGPPVVRTTNARLAVPNTVLENPETIPGGGLPAVLALNGHGGSAADLLPDPAVDSSENHFYWYGDAFARRHWVVLAVEVLHRHDSYVYLNPNPNPIPNPGHPPLPPAGELDRSRPPAMGVQSSLLFAPFDDPDWEEPGERVWDAMRGLDYLLKLPFVDHNRVAATGLSLGGEMTTYLGALEPRVRAVLPAGFSPDLNIENLFGAADWSHRCFAWAYGIFSEYLDVSDYHALVAPRPMVVTTSTGDSTFCAPHLPPASERPDLPVNRPPCWFRGDKQVARRARAAYGTDAPVYVHYLHHDRTPAGAGQSDCHRYHWGGQAEGPGQAFGCGPPNVSVVAVGEPTAAQPLSWQTDDSTNDYLVPSADGQYQPVDLMQLIDYVMP